MKVDEMIFSKGFHSGCGATGCRVVLLAAFFVAILSGCADHARFQQNQAENAVTKAMKEVEDRNMEMKRAEAKREQERMRAQALAPAPRFKTLSPLDTQKVSISFMDEDFRAVLQLLAKAGGYNLIIDGQARQILGGDNRLTAEFEERSIRDVMDYVCQALDLAWEERAGTIFVKALERKIFDLDFLNTIRQSNFNVGGDVLGGDGDGGSGSSASGTGAGTGAEVLTPLTGSYEITGGNTGPSTDIYSEVEAAVARYVGEGGQYYLNRATGTLVVIARPHIVREIDQYMETIREKYRRQVLIEAKIVEVILNRNHEVGIDWKQLEVNLWKNSLNLPNYRKMALSSEILNDGSSWYNLVLQGDKFNISMVLHALEEFGAINTLSNPRLRVMNGQSAMISVGQSVSYLRSFEIQTQDLENSTIQEPEVDIGSLFDGVLMGVTPEIERDGHVNLHLVPIKSDIVSLEEREYANGNRYAFPVVNLREASTVVRAKSGEIIILGGLIHDRTKKGDSGLPGLMHLPGLGHLFKYQKDQKSRVELVIILSITVMGNEQAV